MAKTESRKRKSEKDKSILEHPAEANLMRREVMPFGNSGHIIIPNKYIGNEVYVLDLKSVVKAKIIKNSEKKIDGKAYVLIELPIGTKFYVRKDKAQEFVMV